jgi:hypothetical protein
MVGQLGVLIVEYSMNTDLLDAPRQQFPTALELQVKAQEPSLRTVWVVGAYLLAILPLLLTLLFLIFQLTPYGDACPAEAPCESS